MGTRPLAVNNCNCFVYKICAKNTESVVGAHKLGQLIHKLYSRTRLMTYRKFAQHGTFTQVAHCNNAKNASQTLMKPITLSPEH